MKNSDYNSVTKMSSVEEIVLRFYLGWAVGTSYSFIYLFACLVWQCSSENWCLKAKQKAQQIYFHKWTITFFATNGPLDSRSLLEFFHFYFELLQS